MDTARQRHDKRYFSEKMSKLTIGEIALIKDPIPEQNFC